MSEPIKMTETEAQRVLDAEQAWCQYRAQIDRFPATHERWTQALAAKAGWIKARDAAMTPNVQASTIPLDAAVHAAINDLVDAIDRIPEGPAYEAAQRCKRCSAGRAEVDAALSLARVLRGEGDDDLAIELARVAVCLRTLSDAEAARRETSIAKDEALIAVENLGPMPEPGEPPAWPQKPSVTRPSVVDVAAARRVVLSRLLSAEEGVHGSE